VGRIGTNQKLAKRATNPKKVGNSALASSLMLISSEVEAKRETRSGKREARYVGGKKTKESIVEKGLRNLFPLASIASWPLFRIFFLKNKAPSERKADLFKGREQLQKRREERGTAKKG